MVSSLHLLLAAMTGSGALVWFFQARLNLSWELGFYGEASLTTSALLVTLSLLLALATIQAVASIAFGLKRRWGGLVLLVICGMLVCSSPGPMSWLIAASAMSIVIVLIRDAIAALPDPEDDDEEL